VAGTDIEAIARRMDGAVDALRKELGGLRTGRASTSLLEPIVVDAYGSSLPINQVGTISVPESRMLTVTVWDRGLAKATEKAIRDSGLGLNPQTEGSTIRVPLPELTQERRKELSKVAAKYAEHARVAVRNVRRDGMDGLKKAEKDGAISQDEQKSLSEKIQQATDQRIRKVDELLAIKEKEIMQV
jgi:ribosome recycling factor